MNKYEDVEKLLEKLAKENPEEMNNIDDIDESIFERIEYKALNELEKRQQKKSRIWSLAIRGAAATVALFAVFSIALYFVDLQSGRAKNDVNALATQPPANNDTEYTLNVPKYIPEGYQVDYIDFKAKDIGYFAQYRYVNPINEGYYILVTVEDGAFSPPQESELVEQFDYNNMPFMLYVLHGEDGEPDIYYSEFSDKKGFMVEIEGTISKEELMKIADSIE